MKRLKLSNDLSLPIDAATQTFAFIGRKGSGKTYGAGKLTELLLDAGVQTIILDLVGKWWGLRLAADGRSPGLDIPMFGGLRGDMPLEAAGGALITDALLESGRSAILDISQFSKGGRQEFAYRFGERLWRAQKGQLNPSPVHLVIEENQLIVPENIPAGSKHDFMVQMYSTYEEIIRLGRNYGIGVTMITQRPQSVAKEVLNQAEPLLVFQTMGAHERKAIRDWIRHQGMDETMTDSLPSLKKGECWFWSPEWLDKLQQIKIAPKWTFDSTATPKVGEKRPKARAIKPLDLTDLQEKMKATIEKTKADDPKELRKQIAELQKQLKGKNPAPSPGAIDPKALQRASEKAALERDRHWQQQINTIQRQYKSMVNRMGQIAKLATLNGEATLPAVAIEPIKMPVIEKGRNLERVREQPRLGNAMSKEARFSTPAGQAGDLNNYQRDMLRVLVNRHPIPTPRAMIGALAHKSTKSSAFGPNLSGLVAMGLAQDSRSGYLATEEGLDALGEDRTAPSSGQDALDYWKRSLPAYEASLLATIAEASGSLSREELAAASGKSQTSSAFGPAIRNLLSLDFIEQDQDGMLLLGSVFMQTGSV